MQKIDNLDILFIAASFIFQTILILHFALRKWMFTFAVHYGWIVYALSIPAAGISIILLAQGKSWGLWLGGFIYFVWAIYGYWVEYVRKIQWRNPIYWPVFGPYVFLYLATVMFYWWPLDLIYRPLWYVYDVLFLVSTILNIISHRENKGIPQ